MERRYEINEWTSDKELKYFIGKYITDVATWGPYHFQFMSLAGTELVGIKRSEEDPQIVAMLFKGGIGVSFNRALVNYRLVLPDAEG